MVTYSSTRAQKAIQGDGCRPRRRSRPRSPPLAPFRNSSESRGLCCRSCFGPRTCGRGITNSETAEFSIRVSPSDSYDASRAGLGWVGGVVGLEGMCTLHAVMVLCFIFDEESFSKMFLSVSARVIRLRLTLGISSAFYY